MAIIKVKTGGITADAITDALIADDVVGTEHLTANEVDTTALGADAVTAAQIADDAISEEHLDVTAITGHTAETSIADGDTLLIHDASASALRKMTKANFVSGVGGTNTPAFSAAINGNQNIGNNSATTIAFANELFDTGSDFNTSDYKWTVPETGKYLVNIRAAFEGTAEFFCALSLVKDGTGDIFSITMGHDENNDMMTGSIIAEFGASHVYYVTATQTSGGTVALIGNHQHSEFSVFKLSGV